MKFNRKPLWKGLNLNRDLDRLYLPCCAAVNIVEVWSWNNNEVELRDKESKIWSEVDKEYKVRLKPDKEVKAELLF